MTTRADREPALPLLEAVAEAYAETGGGDAFRTRIAELEYPPGRTDGKPVRVILYARCSTSEQDFTRQLEELREDAKRLGWAVVGELGSHVSGGDNGSDLNTLVSLARRHRIDAVMVWELSRLSRKGPGPILTLIARFEEWVVKVWSHTETWLNVEGPTRDLLIGIFGWVAKWERDMISARTKSALASRKALGVRLGRPPGSKDRRPRNARSKKGTPSTLKVMGADPAEPDKRPLLPEAAP